MPSFTLARRVLRSSSTSSLPAVVPCPETFTSLGLLPELIPLDMARRSPELVYRSVSHISDAQKEAALPEFFVEGPVQMKLIPLEVARQTREIKYRREGFEMREARDHIRALRAELFE